MATTQHTQAARRSVRKAASTATAKAKKPISGTATRTRATLAKQGTARKRTVSSASRTRMSSSPKTRAELYEMAKRKDIPGRSRMRRDELARKLGER
jgi:hypothetical protein